MQYALTFAIEFVVVSTALYAYLFVSGLVSRRPRPSVAPSCALIPDVLIDGDELAAELERISLENRLEQFCAEVEAEAELEARLEQFCAEVEAEESTPAPAMIDVVVPFVRPTKPQVVVEADWAALDPYQLRKECQQRGIRWRNAGKNGKHLRKSEMVAALKKVAA